MAADKNLRALCNEASALFQGHHGMHPACGGGELQDRRVQGQSSRQGVPYGVRATELQQRHQRRHLQTFHRTHAPDQSPFAIFG